MDRILVTEQIADEGLAALRAGAEVNLQTKLDKAALLAMLPEYDALVVRSGTRVTAEVLQAGTKLRVVGRAGTGVDNIDVDAATRLGITVVNAPASNSVAVAELTIGLILALARHIPQARASLLAEKWERSAFMGFEVRGKTLALVGLGRIGAEVARRTRAMEMRVVAYDPVVSTERAAQLGVELGSLDEVLALGDFVSLHVPLVDATRNMINTARLQRMKRGSYLINAARGGIVDEEALFNQLENGHIAGAALDVFDREPPTGNPLLSHPHMIGLPHLGASTLEAQALSGVDVAEGVLAALAGGTPRYAVNAPFIEPEEQGLLGPYVGLGRLLGALCAGLVYDPIRHYEFEYRGELSEAMTIAPIRLALLQGLLAAATEERVTPVNAPILARDRGLRFQEFRTPEDRSYASSVIVRAITADGPREFCGTFIHGQPHVVVADGYFVTFVPQGALLFAYNSDRPGMIGRVGTLLGAADVNISSMDVGRTGPRQSAMMVVRLDEACPPDVLRQIEQVDGITKAYSLVL